MDQIKQRIQMANGSFVIRTYQVLEHLGKGGCAQCYEVQRQEDQKRFAIKVIPKELLLKSDKKLKILRELKLHRSLKHKNICDFYQVFQDQSKIYMLIQLCSNGSFYDLLQVRGKLSVPEVQFYVSQLLDAIDYLHNHQVIHRDIKPGNILLTKDMCLKLSDFGMSTKLSFDGDKKHSIVGTPNFIAPEIIQHALQVPQSVSGHSYQVDLWSVGVILFSFLTGKNPFQGRNKEQTYLKVSKVQYSFPSSFQNAEAKDLISKLLISNPKKRYTIKQVRNHPLFNPKNGIPKYIPENGLYEAPHFKQEQQFQLSKFLNLKLGFKENPEKDIKILNSTLQNQKGQKGFIQQKNVNKTIKKPTIFQIKSDPGDDRLQSSRNTGTMTMLNRLKQFKKQDEDASKQILKLKRSHGPFGSGCTKESTTSLSQNKFDDDLTSIRSFRSAQLNSKNKTYLNKAYGQFQQIEQQQSIKLTYVMDIKRGEIWSYILNNGYIGTYQTNDKGYCVFYNSLDKIFFQIERGQSPMNTTQKYIQANQQIMKRLPYLKELEKQYNQIKCIPYELQINKNQNPLVYVTQACVIKNQSLVFLKLSNGSFELLNFATNTILLIIQKSIYLINIQKGIEKSVILSDVLAASQHNNKVLKQMYKVFKKIMQKFQSNTTH